MRCPSLVLLCVALAASPSFVAAQCSDGSCNISPQPFPTVARAVPGRQPQFQPVPTVAARGPLYYQPRVVAQAPASQYWRVVQVQRSSGQSVASHPVARVLSPRSTTTGHRYVSADGNITSNMPINMAPKAPAGYAYQMGPNGWALYQVNRNDPIGPKPTHPSHLGGPTPTTAPVVPKDDPRVAEAKPKFTAERAKELLQAPQQLVERQLLVNQITSLIIEELDKHLAIFEKRIARLEKVTPTYPDSVVAVDR